jgi:hypothetical protein
MMRMGGVSRGAAAAVLGLVMAFGFGCVGGAPPAGERERSSEAPSALGESVEAPFGEAVGDLGDGPQSSALSPVVRRKMTAEEWAAAAAAKPKGDAPAAPIPAPVTDATRNQAALDKVAGMDPSSIVTVMIELQNQAFDFSAMEHADGAALAGLVAAREAQLQGDQDAMEKVVVAAGGKVTGRLWIGGSAVVASVPAGAVKGLVAGPKVRFVEIQEVANAALGSPYDMGDARATTAVRTQGLIDDGYYADTGNRLVHTSPIRIGVIEWDPTSQDWIRKEHVGYKTASGTNRVQKTYRCASVCTSLTSPPNSGNHGHGVSSIAAGSITEGQDSNYPGTDTPHQRGRSGHAPRADIYYYDFDGTNYGLRVSLQQAVADGIDAVAMSWMYGDPYICNPNADPSSLNATLADARNAGVFLAGCTGNLAESFGTCNIQWPGFRPDVVAVGGLDSSNDLVTYTDLNLGMGMTAIGGLAIVSHGGTSSTASAVGLTAAGYLRNYFADPPNQYGPGSGGCSWATPEVAGAAGELRQEFRAIGWWQAADSANATLVNMLLNGDGWDGWDLAYPGGSVYPGVGPNARSGYGRLRMRWPESGNGMTPSWWWGWQRITVYNGDYISVDVNGPGAEPSGLTEYKLAAIWFPASFSDVSDIDVELWDTCGPLPNMIVQQQDYDYHNRLRIAGRQAAGKCLQVRLRGYAVRAGGEYVYLAHTFHSGTM